MGAFVIAPFCSGGAVVAAEHFLLPGISNDRSFHRRADIFPVGSHD